MMTFFDYWKAFHSILEKNSLPATAQLVGYKLLAEFNGAKFTEEIALTDRELQRQTNIKSLDSIHNAKALLKSVGFIDFNNRKNKPTVYRLIQPNNQTNTNRTPDEHEPNTKTAFLKRAGEDVLDSKDSKTFFKEEEEDARARGYFVSEEVLKTWREYTDKDAIPGAKRELYELENFFGSDGLVKAIRDVFKTFNKVTLELVSGRLYHRGTKGSEKNDAGRNADEISGIATSTQPERQFRDFDEVAFRKFLES